MANPESPIEDRRSISDVVLTANEEYLAGGKDIPAGDEELGLLAYETSVEAASGVPYLSAKSKPCHLTQAISTSL
jgi:hypothetical protein